MNKTMKVIKVVAITGIKLAGCIFMAKGMVNASQARAKRM